MSDTEGWAREVRWRGSYKGQVERSLKVWADKWNVHVEEIDTRDGHDGERPDVVLEWNHSEGPKLIAEIKEIVIPFCSFRSRDGEIAVTVCRENTTSSLKEEAKRVRKKIDRGAKQLQKASGEGYPTLLVVGYWTPVLDQFLDFEIVWAMRGGEHRIRVATHDMKFDLVGPETGGKKLWDDV